MLCSLLLALLWAPRLWAACDPPGERWIAIKFSDGLDPVFARAVSVDVQAGYAFRAASIKLGLTRSAGVSGLMPVISRNQTFSPRDQAAASIEES